MSHHKHDKQEPQEQAKPETAQEQPAAAPQAAQATPPVDEPAALKAERDDLLARLQRVSADYINYQKRSQKLMQDERQYAAQSVMADLVPVLDDLERVIEAAAKDEPDDPLLEGTRLVFRKALEVLGRHGLNVVSADGEAFDPQRHQAIAQEASPQYNTPTVIREISKGYELNGRLLRPARVVVGMPATPQDQ
jgi:molecular chaperone GrpE